MEVEGLPIPYGAPNASPHVERIMRTLREEALDHFIFVTVDHICRVVAEYIRYYNGARPSQAIHGIPARESLDSFGRGHDEVFAEYGPTSAEPARATNGSHLPPARRRADTRTC
jgi:hypothetical protein